MTLTNDQLDALFARKLVEPPSSEFAARIVRAARATHQAPRTNIFANLRAALEFLMPHPAAAFASVLILGLVVGMSSSGTVTLTPHSQLETEDTGAML